MGNKIRQHDPEGIYLVGNRTLQARFFFTPSKEVNAIILGLLAYYADKYDVEIFGFVFMSNHFHMIVRARLLNLKDFMRDLQSQLALKLNKHWGRSGKFFCRRYTDPRLLDDPIVLEKLCYTVCNPCLSNLVSHPGRWPGLSSYDIHKTGEPMVGKRVNHSEKRRLRHKYPEMSEAEVLERATTEYELHMAKLPMWADLDDEDYHATLLEHIDAYALDVEKERRVPCLGAKKICAQRFSDRPKNPKKSPLPLCLASDPKVGDAFKEDYRETVDRYKKSAGAWRRGRREVEFPYGTFPPGRLSCVGAPDAPIPLARAG